MAFIDPAPYRHKNEKIERQKVTNNHVSFLAGVTLCVLRLMYYYLLACYRIPYVMIKPSHHLCPSIAAILNFKDKIGITDDNEQLKMIVLFLLVHLNLS